MLTLGFIHWNVSPDILKIGSFELRWYGVLFAVGFILGYRIVERMFKKEGVNTQWLDSLLLYLIIATVVGARLGHVFFYEWDDYAQHPLDILKIWKGGLASHGGTIGVILAMLLWSHKVSKRNPLWILDRIAVPTALVGALIRTGNLMNSEIYGHQTTLPWGFIFERARDHITRMPETMPKHPTQIYEALAYLLIFGILLWLYRKTELRNRQGFLVGLFLVLVFTARFFIEFVKEVQVEAETGLTLNYGQRLSIPFVIAGIFLIIWALKHPAKVYKKQVTNK
ncbi:MAG: prolipoprotein diacylglyceryl transferase [Bacteroidales bacterium]|jgi:prolipoprotein diacylglyceryl transferase|nr:prolipoprotein diacylglyceryl transferase [Bacteroidales bacterium]